MTDQWKKELQFVAFRMVLISFVLLHTIGGHVWAGRLGVLTILIICTANTVLALAIYTIKAIGNDSPNPSQEARVAYFKNLSEHPKTIKMNSLLDVAITIFLIGVGWVWTGVLYTFILFCTLYIIATSGSEAGNDTA